MVDIIIPCHNAHKYSKYCVNSIIEHTYSEYKLIVIDNGSTDDTKDWSYVTIRNDKNLGFAKSINQGIKAGDSEYICILNNDIIVTPYWLTRMKSHIENKRADIISPCSNYVGNHQMVVLGVYKNQQELNAIADKFHEDNKGACEISEIVIGYCMLFKRSMINEIGLFDERFYPGGSEDLDFCWTANEARYKCGIARDVYIHHFGSVTFSLLGNNVWFKRINKETNKQLEDKWGIKNKWEEKGTEYVS